MQAAVVPTTETGGWKTVKAGNATSIDRVPQKVQKHNRITCVQQVALKFFFSLVLSYLLVNFGILDRH